MCVVSSRAVWQQARAWLVSSSGPPPSGPAQEAVVVPSPQPPQRRVPAPGWLNVVMVVGTCALSMQTHFSAAHFGANVGPD